jgi:predicted nucleotidyltransferase
MSDQQATQPDLFEVAEGGEAGAPASLPEQYQREIERVVAVLREDYAPDKIILFGSYGRGDYGEDSDIDLLIVKETDKRPSGDFFVQEIVREGKVLYERE